MSKADILPLVFLFCAVFVSYSQCLGHDFITWDDPLYVSQNPVVRGFTLGHLQAAFTSVFVGNYAPLHMLSYMLDYTLWGMRPAGFVFSNILLHAINGLVYYFLVLRLLGKRTPAFFAAFIFLCHPVQVESVAWISQRKNVLAMFFSLLALHFYLKYRGAERQKKVWYLLTCLTFSFALLTKAVVVIIPVAMLLYDLTFEQGKRGWRELLTDKIPFLVPAATVAIATVVIQSPELHGGRVPLTTEILAALPLGMSTVLTRYLQLLAWPTDLSVFYSIPYKETMDIQQALSVILVLALLITGWVLYKRFPQLFFWFALFFLGLLPVSQIVPMVTPMNERYLYFPLLGAAPLAGLLLSRLTALLSRRQFAAVGLGILILLPLPVLSFQRAAVWRDSITLWSDAAAKHPGSYYVLSSLGRAYMKEGRYEEAHRVYNQSERLHPLEATDLYNMVCIFLKTGDLTQAARYLNKLRTEFPTYDDGVLLTGNYQYLRGDPRSAEITLRGYLGRHPESGEALFSLGNVIFAQERIDEARQLYEKALAAGNDSVELHYNLATLEAFTGRNEKALESLEKALQRGFRDIQAIMGNNDMATMRTLPQFNGLLSRYFK